MIAALATLAIGLWVGFWAGIAAAIWVSARHDRQWEAEVGQAVAPTLPGNLGSDTPIYDALAIEELRAELEAWGKP